MRVQLVCDENMSGVTAGATSRNMRFNDLRWDWNILSFEMPVVPTATGTAWGGTIEFQIDGESGSVQYDLNYRSGDISKYPNVDQSSAQLIGIGPLTIDRPTYPYYPYLIRASRGQDLRAYIRLTNCKMYSKLYGFVFFGSDLRGNGSDYQVISAWEFDHTSIFNPNEALDDYLTYGDIVIPETTRNTYIFTANGLVAGTPYVFTDTGLVQATTPIIFT